MPRFFFHFYDGETLAKDDTGLEFPCAEHAYLDASEAARAMWADLLASRVDPRECRFHIADEADEELFDLPFSELLDNCARRAIVPSASGDICGLLRETDERAKRACTDVQSALSEVRRALDESNSLLGRLDALSGSTIRR